eukprot:5583287-Pyramimonas_sp.AAC.4
MAKCVRWLENESVDWSSCTGKSEDPKNPAFQSRRSCITQSMAMDALGYYNYALLTLFTRRVWPPGPSTTTFQSFLIQIFLILKLPRPPIPPVAGGIS